MEKLIVAGLIGAGLGAAAAYLVTVQACKDRIVGGVVGAVGKLGGDSTVQALTGQVVRSYVNGQ